MDEFTIIQDGRKFVVIDANGDPKFYSYWEKDCHDWIKEEEDWWNEEGYDEEVGLPYLIRMLR